METLELFERLSVALAIGLLIGLERGWQTRDEREGERAAGLRTFALSSLLGGVWAAIAAGRGDGGLIALAVAFVVFGTAFALFRLREAVHDQTFGVTTVVAAFLAFALGALAVIGDMAVAGAMGVAVAALLALKQVLHGWVARLSWVELRSGLLLLAMTFVLLPLLPNRTVDPWNTLNPYELWLMTILIAAISFAGYIAIKAVGDRHGIVMTGVAGGLVSSTAVTVTMAQLAKEHPEKRDQLLSGALFSSATMMVRVLAVAGAIGVGLLGPLAVPIAAAALALAGAGFYFLRNADGSDDEGRLALTNPFDLWTVLKFGALLTVITGLANLATGWAGGTGAYLLAAVSGIADVDALTLSMARMAADPARRAIAVNAILIVVAVNTVSKAVLGWMTGGTAVGQRLMLVSAVALGAGVLGYLVGPAP